MILLSLLFQIALAQNTSKTEVQVNLCESKQSLSAKLSLSVWKQKDSEVSYLLDNSKLELYQAGMVFKIKINTDTQLSEVILKHNQILNDHAVVNTSADCEYDLHGEQKKLACKLVNPIPVDDFNRIVESQNYKALLSAEQLTWLNELQIQIPENLQMTSAFSDQDFSTKFKNLKFTLGVSVSAKNQEFIEISTRSPSADEKQTQKELLEYLKTKNANLCDDQNSIITRLKLESFFKQKP